MCPGKHLLKLVLLAGLLAPIRLRAQDTNDALNWIPAPKVVRMLLQNPGFETDNGYGQAQGCWYEATGPFYYRVRIAP